MSANRPDDPDAPRDADLRIDYHDTDPPPAPRRRPPAPPPKPGFGFWMSVVWCVLYLIVSQIIGGIVFLVLVYGIALIPEFRANGLDVLSDQAKLNNWMLSPTGLVATLAVVSGTQFTGLLLSWILLPVVVGRGWKRKMLTRLPTATHAALVLIGFPALIGLASVADWQIERWVPSLQDILDWVGIKFPTQGSEALIPLIRDSPWWMAIFAVAISPAICEEVFCRGFIAQGLSGRYRTWAVVLITSFLFGCLHMDPRQGLGAMMLGAAIHGAYVATRSLPVAMFVHFANNGLAVVHTNSQLYPVLDTIEATVKEGTTLDRLLFIGSATLLFLAVGYALYQTRGKLVPTVPGMPSWEPAGVSGVELPPPDRGTVVAHDPLSPTSVALVVVAAVGYGLVLAFV